MTLEYAIDDFSIAQVAAAEHDASLASTMSRRAASWEYEFNPATGYVQARGADGSFPPGAAFEGSQLEPGGQLGFEEGNAVQYTWSVPQDLGALASLMGGDVAATNKLEAFMGSLNASRDAPEDWSGNEPDEWAPWEFDSFGAPDQTQRFVRAIADSEYADAPVDEPGNDDLGALASWYVWAALGLFPVTPGEADLALASPLFPSVAITLPDGRRLVETAPGASSSRPYVHALTVSGLTRPSAGTQQCTGARGGRYSRRDLGHALATGVRAERRGDPALHPLGYTGPHLGLVTGRQPALRRVRPAPGRRVLAAERCDDGDGRAAHGDHDRDGRGRGSGHDGPLAGGA